MKKKEVDIHVEGTIVTGMDLGHESSQIMSEILQNGPNMTSKRMEARF